MLAHALAMAEDGSLPGLKAETVRDLKLANQDGELYRLVLIAQCNALHTAMPFLFEHIADETELLLPDNLCVFRSIVTARFGIVTAEFGNVTDRFGDVTGGVLKAA